ncbi:hypothetical protein ABK040_005475 [Willaertia magna]
MKLLIQCLLVVLLAATLVAASESYADKAISSVLAELRKLRRLRQRGGVRSSLWLKKKKNLKNKKDEVQTESDSSSMIGAGITLRATAALNVRNGACTNKGVIKTLNPGETVTTTGWQGSDCGYLWYGVQGSFGYGYVASNYVQQVGGGGGNPTPAPAGGTHNCGQAYDNGRAIGEKRCVTIDGKNVVDSTAGYFNAMKNAAAQSGIHLQISSGFRTNAEQQYFYNCYKTKSCNNGNLAAAPGYSNHQNGIALDINVANGNVYNWLTRNASRFGFVRTVPSETWHWEYRPGSRCNAFVSYSCN